MMGKTPMMTMAQNSRTTIMTVMILWEKYLQIEGLQSGISTYAMRVNQPVLFDDYSGSCRLFNQLVPLLGVDMAAAIFCATFPLFPPVTTAQAATIRMPSKTN